MAPLLLNSSILANVVPKEIDKLPRIHLARSHLELVVMDLAAPADMAIHHDIAGWIGDHHLGLFTLHEERVGLTHQRIGTDEPVVSQFPDVPELRNKLLGKVSG